jgi:hypothetical protein
VNDELPDDVYEALVEAGKSLNCYEPTRNGGTVVHAARSPATGERPGDDFNRKASWRDILEPHGWRPVGSHGDKVYWRRPDKDRGHSATTGHCSTEARGDLLYVFSANASPLEADRTYSKFEAHATLNHGGDFAAAARDVLAKGYGDPALPMGRLKVTGTSSSGQPAQRPSADNSDDPLDQDATAADLIRANSTIRWVWPNWIPVGVLTILASEPGIGKTRLCADLLRRVHLGLAWPDGAAPTVPPGGCAVWVPADNQHPELGTLPLSFGFPPESLYLNATRRNPFTGTMLDDKEDLVDFEARIVRTKPVFVFIDTCLNASDRSQYKPEDSKAFFVPLQQIAARTQTAIVCVTHTNASGKPLGRRITGQGRVVVQLDKPDPDNQPHRRKLWVSKSNALFPLPLGVTMGNNGNDYDDKPPEAPTETAVADTRVQKAREWLAKYLKTGPKRVSYTRQDAEKDGFDSKVLYRAKHSMGVEEFETEGKKWWQLPSE